MRIWVIGRNVPTPENKMTGSFEYEQAFMLYKHGMDTAYLACIFHPLYKAKKWGYCEWTDLGMPVFAFSQPYAPQRMKLYLDGFKYKKWKKFLEEVEKKNGFPDVIHIHFPTMITVPDVFLDYQKRGAKIICTEHWTKVQTGPLNKHEKEQLSKYVDFADKFLCVGEPLKRAVKKVTGTSRVIGVLPNIASDYFKPTYEKHDGYRFIAVGRLVAVKQFDLIVKAFAGEFKGKSDVSLTIVGGGNRLRKIKQTVKKCGVEEQVFLMGALSRKETAEQVRNSDVLICYSRLETFGVPVIEAWSCGLPVIATEAIGFQEYWDDKLGLLVHSDNLSELQNGMREMYLKKYCYSKKEISLFAESNFSEDAVFKRICVSYGIEDLYGKNK